VRGEVRKMGLFTLGKTVVGQLFGKSPNLRYPLRPAKKTDRTRGHVEFDGSKCISCRLCQKKCPSLAITVEPKKTWTIDRLRCNVCNHCVEICPVQCLSMDTQYPAAGTVRSEMTATYAITWVKPEKPAAAPAKDG
jgi:ech hydrogenase subunit F